jgi:hypothetical protein
MRIDDPIWMYLDTPFVILDSVYAAGFSSLFIQILKAELAYLITKLN